MKAILGFLMVFGMNVAQADSAKLCDNELVIQAVQKVMESIDAETKSIVGISVLAEQPVRVLAGPADANGMSVDTFTVTVNASNVAYSVQMNVDFNNADGTCNYIKKSTEITIK